MLPQRLVLGEVDAQSLYSICIKMWRKCCKWLNEWEHLRVNDEVQQVYYVTERKETRCWATSEATKRRVANQSERVREREREESLERGMTDCPHTHTVCSCPQFRRKKKKTKKKKPEAQVCALSWINCKVKTVRRKKKQCVCVIHTWYKHPYIWCWSKDHCRCQENKEEQPEPRFYRRDVHAERRWQQLGSRQPVALCWALIYLLFWPNIWWSVFPDMAGSTVSYPVPQDIGIMFSLSYETFTHAHSKTWSSNICHSLSVRVRSAAMDPPVGWRVKFIQMSSDAVRLQPLEPIRSCLFQQKLKHSDTNYKQSWW